MSYTNMDHAGWMQSHIDSTRKRNAKLAKNLPEKLNDFQKKVCDILGIVGGGIYNCPINHDKIDWQYGHTGVSVVWQHKEFSTWDFNNLTMLVFLCHEARIRCSISSVGPRNLRLSFWPRTHEGDIAVRHPNLEEAVARFRNELPANHRIRYQSAAVPEEKAS